MLLNLLAVSAENALKGYPKNIDIGEAAIYALLGFLVVFAGIALLIFVVWVVGKIMSSKTKDGKAKEVKRVSKSETEVTESLAIASTVEQAEEISEETIAVITAALMAYYQKNNPKCSFTVKRIKKINRF